MIPYETDPSLHDHEPVPVLLDDGFSPPATGPQDADDGEPAPARSVPATPAGRAS